MWRNIASNALTLFVVVLVLISGLLAWGQQQFAGPGPLVQAVCVKVERGATVAAVSRSLEAQGAITSPAIFRLGADYSGRSGDLKFGSFLLAPGASMAEILGTITEGGQSTCGTEVNFRIGVVASEIVVRELDAAANRYVEVVAFDPATQALPPEYVAVAEAADVRFRVTLAEGTTAWQVVEALRRAEFMTGEIAAVPPEGTLAPDSYEVLRGADRAALLAEMQERQASVLAELWASRAEALPVTSPEEALVLASIIEKETGVAEERGRVASVFVNRLRQGMLLQTDPSVIYGITNGEGVLGRGLRASELRRETPYNTYVVAGLPPTPIANPGRASIEAALNPETTPLLFFVADGSGGHAFAETLDEHNENVARWRQIEADRAQQAPAPVVQP